VADGERDDVGDPELAQVWTNHGQRQHGLRGCPLRSRPPPTVAMLSRGERAIGREEAFVILDRLDQVDGELEHLRQGIRQLLADEN
jgi:hypothetical protein